MLKEKAFAKINLTLDVGLRREDGYHPIDSVMQTVSLHDTLSIEPCDTIEIKSDVPGFDCGESNLCHKAAVAFGRHTGKCGIKLYLEKRIPFKAGLGGGSADAAAVLRGLNRMYGTGLDCDVLRSIAAEIGSDVPFCVEGGTARATGRGEIIENLPEIKRLFVAIAMGGEGLSTSEIYAAFDKDPVLTNSTEAITAAIKSRKKITGLLCNGLEKAASKKTALKTVKDVFTANGAYDTLMSGSGAAIYGVFFNPEDAYLASLAIKKKAMYCTTAYTVTRGELYKEDEGKKENDNA